MFVPQGYSVSVGACRFDEEVPQSRKKFFMLRPFTLSLRVSTIRIWTDSVPGQPECLTFWTTTRPLEGFSLFPLLALILIVVSNVSFSPSPDNGRCFAFVKMVKEIKIIAGEWSWIYLFVPCVYTVTLSSFIPEEVRTLTDVKGVATADGHANCSWFKEPSRPLAQPGQTLLGCRMFFL